MAERAGEQPAGDNVQSLLSQLVASAGNRFNDTTIQQLRPLVSSSYFQQLRPLICLNCLQQIYVHY